MKPTKRFLGVFSLALINVAAIVSLRNLSFMVEYGFSAVPFYIAASLLFFIPTALVCAELATAWPEAIGIYGWVARAFGPRIGFVAQWMNWMFSIASFPTVLTFLAATIAYLIEPSLAQNKHFMFFTVVIIFWVLTLINFLGMKTSTTLSTVGAFLGTVIPGCLIILLALIWLLLGKPIELDVSSNALIPNWSLGNFVFFGAVVLGLAGMEMSAFYANETEHPKKVYPKAILLSTLLILGISILGSLAMAVVVPKISIVSGVMQVFNVFFNDFGMGWAVKLIALLAIIGSFAGNNTWIIGPAKGLHHALVTGYMPKWLSHKNKHDQPVAILFVQAILGTILALAFYVMPSVDLAFWLVTAITTQFAMAMYVLVFAAAIKLRKNHPEVQRPYQIPGGMLGMIVFAGSGIGICCLCFALGFIPPEQFKQVLTLDNLFLFEGYLIAGLILFSLPALVCKQQSLNPE
ncbi:MAG: amino acid permease [Proteobacteria bacterium]|nr:amino acid permease [Pseudomonadota bacterium]